MAKLITIQKRIKPYIVDDDYDISESILWNEIDKVYFKNDNYIGRTDEQCIISKDSLLEGL